MRCKSSTFDLFESFLFQAENFTGRTLKKVVSDNGGEFGNKCFSALFDSRCGTTSQSEKSLRREIVNYTSNNVCCATGAAEAAFRSDTALERVVLRKRKVWLFV
jgi:hypothetical protein